MRVYFTYYSELYISHFAGILYNTTQRGPHEGKATHRQASSKNISRDTASDWGRCTRLTQDILRKMSRQNSSNGTQAFAISVWKRRRAKLFKINGKGTPLHYAVQRGGNTVFLYSRPIKTL